MSSIYLWEKESIAVTKMIAVSMSLFTPILAKNIADGEPAFKKAMWIAQAFIHVPFTAVMLLKAFGK
jgi:hypothetical protein